MIGKKYTSISDGKVVEVKDFFEDIVILTDNSKIKTTRLFDKSYFEEYIDPRNFFNNQNLFESFAQKIKQIPDELINKMTSEEKSIINESLSNTGFNPSFNDSAVLPADPELEKEELMKKYGINNKRLDKVEMDSRQETSNIQAQKQLDRFASLIEELQEDTNDEPIQRVEVQRDNKIDIGETLVKEIQKEDPIISMFKNVKRNKEFKISLDIINNIPRPDFIEMMEDSYNTSIIDFLAEEFTNCLLADPSIIKNKIITEIKKIVYSNDDKEKTRENSTKVEEITPKPSKTRTTRIKKDLTK